MMDSSATSLLEQVSTASTVTETHEENKKDIGPVVDALVERLVGDILDDFGEDKTTLLKQLRQSSSEPEQDEGEYFDTYFGCGLEGNVVWCKKILVIIRVFV